MRIPGVMLVGTDTEVGKTYVACRLIERWLRLGICIGAYKPVASGALSEEWSDASLLWKASGHLGTLEQVNPQSFSAALAPPIAAELEGRNVDEELLVRGALEWEDRCDFLVVEGAGGLMSPISWTMTNAHLAQALDLPLILVAPNQLGVVSQVLTTLTAAKALRLRVRYVVLNAAVSSNSTHSLAAETNARLLSQFLLETQGDVPQLVQLQAGGSEIEPAIDFQVFNV